MKKYVLNPADQPEVTALDGVAGLALKLSVLSTRGTPSTIALGMTVDQLIDLLKRLGEFVRESLDRTDRPGFRIVK